ncbi:Alpha/Beta hydrolase protein [Xylariales sp. PMI_506]|nr:Alpha/Beta hydrolase protein [Xylariales sp. PMI_506]
MLRLLQVATLVAAAVASALPQRTASTCREIEIPITVSVERYIVNATINDNWDAASLTLNLTRQDSGKSTDALPLNGMTPGPVESTYTLGATLCGHGGPMLILTHGIIESKLYFNPNFRGSKSYNFVEAAIAAGYSVLNYDRIGVGSSSKVDSHFDAQFQVETAVLSSLITYARTSAGATKVVLVGHSYGAYISVATAGLASAAAQQVDAVVLTGFSGTFDYFGPFVAGAGFRVARLQDPARWSALDPGYLTSSDLYAETYAYFAYSPALFDRAVAQWAYDVASEPFAVGELPTVLVADVAYANVTAPVLLLQGRYDVSACGGDCIGVLDAIKGNFTSSSAVEIVDDLPSGHNLFLHKIAPTAFKMVFDFLKKQGV